MLPVDGIPRVFTPGVIAGSELVPTTGASLAPGQVILDERIDFLKKQGVPVPTCKKEFAGGLCPPGTPRAGFAPNSAGASALQSVYGLASVEKEIVAIAKNDFLAKTEDPKKKVRRSHGRTFNDFARMTKAQIDEVLGESRNIGFALGEDRIVHFRVDKVSLDGGLTLAGAGKKVAVSASSITYTEDGATSEVEPETAVISMTSIQKGRRGGGGFTTGGSFMVSSSNRSGNS
jgi:hypothetical protein